MGAPIQINKCRLWLVIGALICCELVSCHKDPHSVTLKWNPPPAAPGVIIVSYNIYRSTTSGGPFVRLASGILKPPYEDRLVNSGRTYFYVVTAVDQAGRESKFSGQATAAIP